jgi:hypothetical protein
MVVTPCDDLADIVEQGLKVGRQRIAGAMQMPDHLVQIIPKPYKLPVNQPIGVSGGFAFARNRAAGIEQHRTAEMTRPHTERQGASLDAFQLACREAEIELRGARF